MVVVLAGRLRAAGEVWTILSADYGIGDQRRDVTKKVRRLLSNGRLRVVVSNQALAGDPAPGRVKTLRIRVRGSTGAAREFTYRENESLSRDAIGKALKQLELSHKTYHLNKLKPN